MIDRTINQLFQRLPRLQSAGLALSRAVHKAVLQGGPPARQTADLLHGVWLGHPLHPVLTDAAIGAWTMGSLFDLLSLGGSRTFRKAGNHLVTIGTIAALPTAASGLADFSTIPQGSAGPGLGHALLNTAGLALYALSVGRRRRGCRRQGLLLSAAGLGLVTASAYLGGHLVYDRKVGVNHSPRPAGPGRWTPVLDERELPDHRPVRVEVEGNPVLLYRHANRVYALSAVCPHAGGPLDEGQVKGLRVQCPWHDSVFDLRDGRNIHGPSAFCAPHYETEIRAGQVRLRLAS